MMRKQFIAIILYIAATTGIVWIMSSTGANNVYGQNALLTAPTNQTAAVSPSVQNESPIISTYVPLIGQLSKANYIHLTDLTGFKVVRGELAMQVPCDYKGNPKVIIIAGVASNFKTVNMGSAISNATLDGRPILHLSNGVSCLYNAVIPAGTTSIALVNTSGGILGFLQGQGYGVTITAQLR